MHYSTAYTRSGSVLTLLVWVLHPPRSSKPHSNGTRLQKHIKTVVFTFCIYVCTLSQILSKDSVCHRKGKLCQSWRLPMLSPRKYRHFLHSFIPGEASGYSPGCRRNQRDERGNNPGCQRPIPLLTRLMSPIRKVMKEKKTKHSCSSNIFHYSA